MSNETFEEYWHRLRETELKNKEPIRVDTKYQCRLAWSARGEIEKKKIIELEKTLQAERRKVAELKMIIESYCCCAPEMDTISGVCCFCDDLERIKKI